MIPCLFCGLRWFRVFQTTERESKRDFSELYFCLISVFNELYLRYLSINREISIFQSCYFKISEYHCHTFDSSSFQ